MLLSEGGESQLGTNVNYLLEEYGMSVHTDSVVRTTFHKYLHPKEVFISHGLLDPEVARTKHRSVSPYILYRPYICASTVHQMMQ
jgi:intraflagellar transport protein 52